MKSCLNHESQGRCWETTLAVNIVALLGDGKESARLI
jgi:hypothetical protein